MTPSNTVGRGGRVVGALTFKNGCDRFCIAFLRSDPADRRHLQLLGFILLQFEI